MKIADKISSTLPRPFRSSVSASSAAGGMESEGVVEGVEVETARRAFLASGTAVEKDETGTSDQGD